MSIPFTKYMIIGAGLSGLTTAYVLRKAGETDMMVLESRKRIGGRIFEQDRIDFGGTWFQSHHLNVLRLLDELGIAKFHQYVKGKSVLVYRNGVPERYFESDPNTPSAYRIVGGSMALVNSLANGGREHLMPGVTVRGLRQEGKLFLVETDQGSFKSEKVVVTVPPKITDRILFEPELPKALRLVMAKTHTWMSNSMKVGLTFQRPFWRAKGLSGTLIGQTGAVTELYDHSDASNRYYALMGFINEGLRVFSETERKKRILHYLATYLGEEVNTYTTYEEKDWSQDRHTSEETEQTGYDSLSYGNVLFQRGYLNNSLVFSGTETASSYGGYMDGAISSGIRAAKQLLEHRQE
ncbi:flavin monoamine oxidase family protein [Maribacter sp. 2-571]|uniref:flavin monoamine oxidase family protein n=1 Tax=Maribacter sp. 2-571 TaxID=3417569 RepID=UPI003D351A10